MFHYAEYYFPLTKSIKLPTNSCIPLLTFSYMIYTTIPKGYLTIGNKSVRKKIPIEDPTN